MSNIVRKVRRTRRRRRIREPHIYSALIQLSDPVTLTDTFEKESCNGLPVVPTRQRHHLNRDFQSNPFGGHSKMTASGHSA